METKGTYLRLAGIWLFWFDQRSHLTTKVWDTLMYSVFSV